MDTGLIEMPKSALELPESQVTPEPGLEKRTRRQFTPEYKLRMIAEADACEHGELGALCQGAGVVCLCGTHELQMQLFSGSIDCIIDRGFLWQKIIQ